MGRLWTVVEDPGRDVLRVDAQVIVVVRTLHLPLRSLRPGAKCGHVHSARSAPVVSFTLDPTFSTC